MKQRFGEEFARAVRTERFYVQRGFTNVNGGDALPFVHNMPSALREAWNRFDGCCTALGKSAWFVRLEYRSRNAEDVGAVCRWQPAVMDRFNNSRRMRRVGVTGARLANVYHRGEFFYYVSDSVFADYYAAACMAYSLVWKATPSAVRQRVTVELKHGTRGRSGEKMCVNHFMREFRERSKFQRTRWSIDPVGGYEVEMTANDNGVTMGFLCLLVDVLGHLVESVRIGTHVVISSTNTADSDDYEETLSRPYRAFRFKFLTTFGDLYEHKPKQ